MRTHKSLIKLKQCMKRVIHQFAASNFLLSMKSPREGKFVGE